jgi:hypothetical protein
MPRYRVLRDFGSHLGNHYRGQVILLPDGDLPRGFAGLVERVADPTPDPEITTKDVRPATARADDVPPEAGSVPPADGDNQPQPHRSPTPADEAQAGFYDDKALRPKADRGRR